MYEGEVYTVKTVSDCRAYCVPERKRHVEIAPIDGSPKRVFEANRNGVSLSPNSELEFLQ